MVIMNYLEWPMFSYYVICYTKFKNVMQQTEKVALTMLQIPMQGKLLSCTETVSWFYYNLAVFLSLSESPLSESRGGRGPLRTHIDWYTDSMLYYGLFSHDTHTLDLHTLLFVEITPVCTTFMFYDSLWHHNR